MQSTEASSSGSGRTRRPRLGLCSVTLRAHEPDEVIALALDASLESIEWGSDVHVPVGDLDRAVRVGERTRRAGLAVASYGTYFGFPWNQDADERIEDIVETAVALGAPRIRVWSGPTASAESSPTGRAETVRRIADIATAARRSWISTSVEYHHNTLSDSAGSTLELVRELRPAIVSSYWQPRIGASDAAALDDLTVLADAVTTVHAFAWDESMGRHPLATRAALWAGVSRIARVTPSITDVLLEFLPGDDVSLLGSEAQTLRQAFDHERSTP